MKRLIHLGIFIPVLFLLIFSCGTESGSSSESGSEGSSTSNTTTSKTSSENPRPAKTKDIEKAELAKMSKEERLAYYRTKSEEKLSDAQRDRLIGIRNEQNQMNLAEQKATLAKVDEVNEILVDEDAQDSKFAKELTSFIDAGKIDKRRRFVLDQVSFDESGNLAPSSNVQIQAIKQIMDRYPRLNIGFLGYSNLKLKASEVTKITERRGKMIADILVSKGIAGNRLGFQGLGKSPAGTLDPERIELVVMGL